MVFGLVGIIVYLLIIRPSMRAKQQQKGVVSQVGTIITGDANNRKKEPVKVQKAIRPKKSAQERSTNKTSTSKGIVAELKADRNKAKTFEASNHSRFLPKQD